MNVRTSTAGVDPGRAFSMRGSLSNRAELREVAMSGRGIRRLVACVAEGNHVHRFRRARRRDRLGWSARGSHIAVERSAMRDGLAVSDADVERARLIPVRL